MFVSNDTNSYAIHTYVCAALVSCIAVERIKIIETYTAIN